MEHINVKVEIDETETANVGGKSTEDETGLQNIIQMGCDIPFIKLELNQNMRLVSTNENIILAFVQTEKLVGKTDKNKKQSTSRRNSKSIIYKCRNCSVIFPRRLDLRRHKLECALRDCCAKCQVCDKLCDSKDSLVRHMMYHNAKKRFECNECKRVFRLKNQLERHITTHLPRGMRTTMDCDICNKSFTSRSGYRAHIKVHSDDHQPESYLCEICGNLYTTWNGLTLHQKHHTGESNYVCHICGKCTRNKAYSRLHLKIHHNPIRYTCEQCGKTFAWKDSFDKHKYIHSGSKPFPCSECNKSYVSRYKLTCHARIHSGIKPYMCNMCPEAFAQNVSLRNHKANYHKDDLEKRFSEESDESINNQVAETSKS